MSTDVDENVEIEKLKGNEFKSKESTNVGNMDKSDVPPSFDNLLQASTDSVEVEEPSPSDAPQREVHFADDVHSNNNNPNPQYQDTVSNITPFSSNKVDPISISTPPSNTRTSQLSPNEQDDRLRDILQTHGGLTAHAHTIRSLEYLHSLRVKDNLYPNYNPKNKGNNNNNNNINNNNNGNDSYYAQSSPMILSSPMSKSNYTTNDVIITAQNHFDELDEEESKINESLSNWTLKFESPLREKQFRIYVTERYGTSIRVAILSMIVAYIFLAGTNGSFVKDTIRVTFVCLGLLVMLITFSIASSFSRASSSATISYLKSLFQSDDNAINTNGKAGEKTPDTNSDNQHAADSNQNGSIFSTLSAHCHRLFALYSSYMMSVCVMLLLLLLILQNTLPSKYYLSDEKFLVYYILASLVTSTYGTLSYKAYIILSWSLWLLWNILAIAISNTTKSGQEFDFWGVNIALVIGQLVLGHQVKAKDLARRKSFLRAMNYVHHWNQSRTDSAMQKSQQIPGSAANLQYRTSTNKTTPRRLPSMYDNNSRGFDIASVPSIRDKLCAAVLGEVVDRSLAVSVAGDKSRKGSDSNDRIMFPDPSPRKRRRHDRQRSKLYNDIRREITKRDTSHGISSQTGAASELGAKLGLTNKRESKALGIFNVIRGFGGHLSHLDTYHEEVDDTVSDLLEQSRRLSVDIEPSKSNKLKDRTGKSDGTIILDDNEEKYQNNDATLLATVQSQKSFDDNNDKIPDSVKSHHNNMQLLIQTSFDDKPHCGSIHELPRWYSLSAESYVLCGYRINYDAKLCMKSMFHKHNETMNIWTEFIPALILFILIIYFNTENGDFWANSDIHSSFTKSILHVSIPFVMVRPIISGLAHTFSCISKKASKIWWKLDFLSIILASGFGSIIWIHCVFFCDANVQTLYMFAIFALSFSTMVTSLTTKNTIIRDVSLGAFFVFTLIFIYFYELYILLASTQTKNMSYPTILYWTISVSCTFFAVVFRASKYPEAFFVKRRFKKLMQTTFKEKFSIQSGGKTMDHRVTDTLTTSNEKEQRQQSFKQQVSFARMLEDIQSFTIHTENKLAKIENMEQNLYDDMDNAELEKRRKKLVQEIENLENEIVNEIKNEIQIEQCMEEAYVNLISEDQKQWFNYLFTSHNFWHIFMNLAVMFSVVAWREYFNWRAMESNVC